MRASVESCLFASLLATQSLALPTRPLAAPPPVHGEAAEEERDGAAANNVVMAHGDVLIGFLVFANLLYALKFFLEERRKSVKDHTKDLDTENQKLKARVKALEMEHKELKASAGRENLKAGDGQDVRSGLLAMAKSVCGDPPKS